MTFAIDRSPSGAVLHRTNRPSDPLAVVLVLHGGRQQSTAPTAWHQAAVLRPLFFAQAVARHGGGQGGGQRGGHEGARLAVIRLRYAVRGWNATRGSSTEPAPVRDGRWALGRVAEIHPGLPIGLMGYSMGARAALRLSGEPGVRSLVTLAAWVEQADMATWQPNPGLSVLLLHGAADRVTSPRGSVLAGARLRDLGAQTEVEVLPAEGHDMLRHTRHWHRRAAEHLTATLVAARGTPGAPTG